MCPRTHCSCRKHCNFLCHRAWSCWGTCYTYCYFFWKLQTALKYTTVQQPFSSPKISLAFTEEQLPSRTVHFLNCPFYSLFSSYLRSQYLSVVYFVFYLCFGFKTSYSKRILWKVFSDNRMGIQGNQLFSDWDISFYGESGEIGIESCEKWNIWQLKQISN